MPDHASRPAPPLWRRLLTTEPALVRGVVTALVALALVWGIDLADVGERVASTVDIVLGVLVPLLGAWWIRGAVSPAIKELA